jgi:DNA-binding response OmpR family regulator
MIWGHSQLQKLEREMEALRQKIETNPRRPQYLLTVHGLGYKFVG